MGESKSKKDFNWFLIETQKDATKSVPIERVLKQTESLFPDINTIKKENI